MKAIEYDSVSKHYAGISAVAGFSLTVEKGERIVILGPSGCGKTTLLRLTAGFLAPDEGSISINGEMVAAGSKIIKGPDERNIGMVFQDLALWPHFSVKGNIEFGLKANGVPRAERQKAVSEVLDMMQMEEYADYKPAALSGGQQQRVALARALVLKPKTLLMDEPLSSLDVDIGARLRAEIVKLQESLRFTLLYVTHDREAAYDIATRIIVMGRGEIAKVGYPDEIRECYRR